MGNEAGKQSEPVRAGGVSAQDVLTDDEYTVLLICAQGESLAAIARWEKPIDSLVAKGLLQRNDKFNNVITPKGREAAVAREAQDDKALKIAFSGLRERTMTCVCAGCDQEVRADWTYCPNCGAQERK